MNTKLKGIIRNILNEWGEDQIKQMQARLDEKKATGKLASSIFFNYVQDTDSIIFYIPDYGLYVDSGREPGKWPLVDAISRWVETKGIDQKWDVPNETATFLVGRKIFREGIEPFPFLNIPNDNKELLAEQLAEQISINIEEEFTRTFKQS